MKNPKINYFKNGTSASAISLCIGTASSMSLAEIMNNSITPFGSNIIFWEPVQKYEPIPLKSHKKHDPKGFLDTANRAYALLDSCDRDEMDIWDATLNDGLADS